MCRWQWRHSSVEPMQPYSQCHWLLQLWKEDFTRTMLDTLRYPTKWIMPLQSNVRRQRSGRVTNRCGSNGSCHLNSNFAYAMLRFFSEKNAMISTRLQTDGLPGGRSNPECSSMSEACWIFGQTLLRRRWRRCPYCLMTWFNYSC